MAVEDQRVVHRDILPSAQFDGLLGHTAAEDCRNDVGFGGAEAQHFVEHLRGHQLIPAADQVNVLLLNNLFINTASSGK